MSDPAPNPIEALRAMLDAGAAIVDGVLADELMARWIEAFVVMPVADRMIVWRPRSTSYRPNIRRSPSPVGSASTKPPLKLSRVPRRSGPI